MKYLTFLLLPVIAKENSVCDIPDDFLNGSIEEVKKSADRQFFVGLFKCNPGYTLSGSSLVKCRRGRWSHKPLCLGIVDSWSCLCKLFSSSVTSCDPDKLPEIENGQRTQVKKTRKGMFRYQCNNRYKLYGQSRVYCTKKGWNINSPPFCSSK